MEGEDGHMRVAMVDELNNLDGSIPRATSGSEDQDGSKMTSWGG